MHTCLTRRRVWQITVVVLFVAASLLLVDKYFLGTAVRNSKGEVVADLKDSDFGTFSKPEFHGVVEKYLANLDKYRLLQMTRLTSNPADVAATGKSLLPVISRAIEARDASFSTLPESERGALLASLSEEVALLLARGAGLSNDEYLKRTGPTVLQASASDLEAIKFVDQTYLDGKLLKAAPDETSLGRREVFDALYKVAVEHKGGASKAVGWCPQSEGFRCVTYEALSDAPYDSPLFNRMPPQDKTFFFGSLADNSAIFARPPESETAANGPITRFAEVATIVQTTNDDRFPMVFQLFYDTKQAHWFLKYAHRQVSPRMGNLPQVMY